MIWSSSPHKSHTKSGIWRRYAEVMTPVNGACLALDDIVKSFDI